MNPEPFIRPPKVTYSWFTWESWRQPDGSVQWKWTETCWNGYDTPEKAHEVVRSKSEAGPHTVTSAFFRDKVAKLMKKTVTYEEA